MTFEHPLYHPDNPCTQPGVNPDDWFPERCPSEAQAAALCAGCPMLEKCRDYAKTHRLGGVWGGKYFPHTRNRIYRTEFYL